MHTNVVSNKKHHDIVSYYKNVQRFCQYNLTENLFWLSFFAPITEEEIKISILKTSDKQVSRD